MQLEALKNDAVALDSHKERIKLFGWWLTTHGGKTHFQGGDIKACYGKLSIAPPTQFGNYIGYLTERKELLKEAKGYTLESKIRAALDKRYGQSKQTVAIKKLLKDLPAQLPTLAEQKYLDEALICYEHEAFRAAVVMTWNLAYAHLCDHVVKNRLADFNARWQQEFKGDHKNGPRAIVVVDDFAGEELGENKVLKICLNAGIIPKNVFNVLEPGLKRRNAAAHPNNVVIKQVQADAYIDDMITNAVLLIV